MRDTYVAVSDNDVFGAIRENILRAQGLDRHCVIEILDSDILNQDVFSRGVDSICVEGEKWDTCLGKEGMLT